LTAVVRQASTFEACCSPGGMIAVLAHPALFAEEFLSSNSELAAINFASHFVVSAKQDRLADIELGLKNRSVTFQRLPVSIAFHSQWIDCAKAPFESLTNSIRRTSGKLPLMCCDQAVLLDALPDNYFWKVARHPIRFREAITELEREGAYRYIDAGPAGTLATFLKYSLPAASKSSVHSILTPYGHDQKKFAALLASSKH
jgi:bacillaene synthase trans-acting acyltransferase